MNILILVLLLQSPSKWEKVSHITIASMNIAQFADLSTTMYMQGKGGFKEANPLLKSFSNSPVKMALVKGGIATGVGLIFIKLHKKHPKLVTICSGLVALGTGYVAYRNSKLERGNK